MTGGGWVIRPDPKISAFKAFPYASAPLYCSERFALQTADFTALYSGCCRRLPNMEVVGTENDGWQRCQTSRAIELRRRGEEQQRAGVEGSRALEQRRRVEEEKAAQTR